MHAAWTLPDDMTKPQPGRNAIPTTLILDFHDSYTRNLLKLVSQLGALDEPGVEGWEQQGWEDRVVVVNVDSMTW